MQIIVKTITGKLHTFDCSYYESVFDLKTMIFQKTRIESCKQKLMQNSVELSNQMKVHQLDEAHPVLLVTLTKNKQITHTETTEAVIEQIMAMGFDRLKVKKCLEASFFNEELAISYLINGIPDLTETKKNYTVTKTQMRMIQQLGASQGLEDLRKIYQQDPDSLLDIFDKLKKTNIELFHFFSSNSNLFIQILKGNNKIQTKSKITDSAHSLKEYQLSPEDNKIVEFLKGFGFEEDQCIEAYFICDKNAELTVNYLLND